MTFNPFSRLKCDAVEITRRVQDPAESQIEPQISVRVWYAVYDDLADPVWNQVRGQMGDRVLGAHLRGLFRS
jgi:hypothetical protein